MITVCSQCKRIISETLQDKNKEQEVSHGICSQCLAVLEDKIRENNNDCIIDSSKEKELSLD